MSGDCACVLSRLYAKSDGGAVVVVVVVVVTFCASVCLAFVIAAHFIYAFDI